MPEFRQQLDILDRQIKLRVLGIFEQNALMRGTGCGNHLKPFIAPDAVIHMHDQITRAQALRLGQEVLCPPLFARSPDQPVPQNILLGNDNKPRCLEPGLQRPDGQMHAFGLHIAQIRNKRRIIQPFVLHQTGKPFARAIRIAGDDDGTIMALCFNVVR